MSEANKEHCQTETQLPGEWREVKVSCPHCTSDQFVYIYDDQKTCYCCQCDAEFNVLDVQDIIIDFDNEDNDLASLVSDDPATVKLLADRTVNGACVECKCNNGCHLGSCKYSPVKHNLSQYNFNFKKCSHTPQQIIEGDGWGVWGGKKEDCLRYAKDFDVVLNLTFTSIKEPHVIPIPELQEFEDYGCRYKEIQLDWPDYGVIVMPKEFWQKLLNHLETNKLRMLVFCTGGHGRTGTALAVMMTMALDFTPTEAIDWLREHYCDGAVETLNQEEYVRNMAPKLAEAAEAGR